jgi:uncharacterized membrane protein HdeD (DUF308 family)
MSTFATTPGNTSQSTAFSLRRLYFVRFAFALAWAGIFATTGSSLGLFAAVLLFVYPAFDALAALMDSRSTNRAGIATGTQINIVISAVAAIGLAYAASADITTVLRVWGAWAVAAGLVQLVVAVSRRHLGGQWAMIVSGGLSVLVGSLLILTSSDTTSTARLSGYAAAGGIFFLVSAVRMRRAAKAS